jgi:hypothetical protein
MCTAFSFFKIISVLKSNIEILSEMPKAPRGMKRMYVKDMSSGLKLKNARANLRATM